MSLLLRIISFIHGKAGRCDELESSGHKAVEEAQVVRPRSANLLPPGRAGAFAIDQPE
jgi:hypothetical protein